MDFNNGNPSFVADTGHFVVYTVDWKHSQGLLLGSTAQNLLLQIMDTLKLAAIRQKRITLLQAISSVDSDDCSESSTAEKGHFVAYTTDQKRFVLPLDYLDNEIVKGLFNVAEEEFGLTSNGPFTLPCDAAFMEYAITLIQHNVARDVEKAMLIT
ncbi:unnamed protein product [Dovyalis caffra]|uniref:SAUR family protein n=1 Tax=Dovyalis caffra TaxID=77055 RepID=A0AAV1R9A6_9ROSI|nr:unnamed protein product [Dovyalis caffra]